MFPTVTFVFVMFVSSHISSDALFLMLLYFSFSENLPTIDFKGEALTFRTTAAAVIDTVEHCSELVQQREESWRRRLERETDRRRQAEALAGSYFTQLQKSRGSRVVHPGPDLEVSH